MSDDLLREATRALADSAESQPDAASFTRARVLRDVHRNTRRRVSRTLVLIPVAAVLMGATAAAATSGGLSRTWRNVIALVAGERLDGDEPQSRPPPPPPVEAKQPAKVAPKVDEPESPEPAPEPSESASPPPAKVALAPSAKPTRSDAGNAAEKRELDLYRAAHRAHFVEHDYAKALKAWNDYLGHAPRGRFGAEAQYNRAICLVRLGRNAEAEQALQPFADGRWGNYRKDEAARLISALRGDAEAAP